jgi:hypothetical protein
MAKKSKRSSSTSAAVARNVEFNPDYSNVKKDLVRIGSLAGFFFALLIVLSFFLN